MGKRAAAAEETRRRIIDATHALHIEQGVAATSWDDIAARAGVGVGTVYRHFPSLDELIPACTAFSMEIVGLPDAAAVAATFEGAEDRVGALVRGVFAIYERGAPELRAMLNAGDVHPRLQEGADGFEATLGGLIATAAIPGGPRVVCWLLDIGTWDALRREGLSPDEAVAAVGALLRQRAAAD